MRKNIQERLPTTTTAAVATLESQEILIDRNRCSPFVESLPSPFFPQKTVKEDILTRMHLLQPRATLVQSPVDGSGDGQSSAHDGADADEEAREGFGAGFAVDDFHGGDVL